MKKRPSISGENNKMAAQRLMSRGGKENKISGLGRTNKTEQNGYATLAISWRSEMIAGNWKLAVGYNYMA